MSEKNNSNELITFTCRACDFAKDFNDPCILSFKTFDQIKNIKPNQCAFSKVNTTPVWVQLVTTNFIIKITDKTEQYKALKTIGGIIARNESRLIHATGIIGERYFFVQVNDRNKVSNILKEINEITDYSAELTGEKVEGI